MDFDEIKSLFDNSRFSEFEEFVKCKGLSSGDLLFILILEVWISLFGEDSSIKSLFDDVFLFQGNNKVISKIESCAYGLLYIGLGGNDAGSIISEDFEIKLLNFIQRIAQSDNLGKISILNLKNTLQKDFLNAFYEIQSFILGDNQDNINESS